MALAQCAGMISVLSHRNCWDRAMRLLGTVQPMIRSEVGLAMARRKLPMLNPHLHTTYFAIVKAALDEDFNKCLENKCLSRSIALSGQRHMQPYHVFCGPKTTVQFDFNSGTNTTSLA
jgi:hypothetical protein